MELIDKAVKEIRNSFYQVVCNREQDVKLNIVKRVEERVREIMRVEFNLKLEDPVEALLFTSSITVCIIKILRFRKNYHRDKKKRNEIEKLLERAMIKIHAKEKDK